MKKYLRMTQLSGTAVPSGRVIVGVRMQDEWVSDIARATSDFKPAIETTQHQLLKEQGLATTLVEIPETSKWVICKEFREF